MTRLVTGGAILLPFLGLLSATAAASTEFEDIPYLQVRINQVLEHEPTGAEVEWRNEATGNAGVIRVLKTYFPSPDAPCRDYERTTRQPGGADRVVLGTGCRDASGRWALKEQEEAEASGPERLDAPAQGAASPAQPGGGAGETGGEAGQTGGQGGAQTETRGETGGAGQTGQDGGTGSSPTTVVQPAAAQPEPAPPQTAPEAATPTAPKASEPAPSPPDFDLPTPSD